MRSAERPREVLWRARTAVGVGVAEFRADYPPAVFVVTTLARSALQCLFFTILAGVVGGEEQRAHAFVGGVVVAVTMCCAVTVCDVPMQDKLEGTFAAQRVGVLPPLAVIACRALPHGAAGLACSLTALVVVAPLTGQAAVALQLLVWTPMLVLVSATTLGAGVAVAALAIGPRMDVAAGNLLSYAVLLCSGAFLLPGRLPPAEAVGQLLPATHALAAIRSGLAGGPWFAETVREFVVGVCWAGLATVVVGFQVSRARRSGKDDFA